MQILVVDEDRAVREKISSILQSDGFDVAVASDGPTAIELGRQQSYDLVFCDVKIGKGKNGDLLRLLREEVQPQADIILMTGQASIESALEAVRRGARDYIVKPFSPEELSGLARTAMERRQFVRDASSRRGAAPEFGDLIGRSGPMVEIFKTVERVAMTDLPVLIYGETGTGKGVIARAIHANSPRSTGPFFVINCGAWTEAMLEAELFGESDGEIERPGLFERAEGGTLLLDEVSEASLRFQDRLASVLRDNTVFRVGSELPRTINVRMIATTNRDPEAIVASDMLREELLYRLSVVSIRMPPLRERSGDVDLMVAAFLRRYSQPGATPKRVAADAAERLRAYSWPGNVRELRHTVQRLAVRRTGAIIRVSDLPEKIRNTHGDLDELLHEMPAQDVVGPAWRSEKEKGSTGKAGKGASADHTWLPLSELERRYLVRVLYHTRGNKKRAAEILKVDRKTLSRMVDRHAINVTRIKRDVRGVR